MKSAIILSALATTSMARPFLLPREVPQEHSHEQFLTSVRASLNKNNPNGIVDPVFGLLGDAAAKQGLGKLTDVECLQTATADQAFTNAKASGDVKGMVDALIYRALERNTGSVGMQSNACTSFKPVNRQIAALSQHQDPASSEAAATNKGIELQLAKQIASVGGDPQLALQSATFAPGKIGDPTARGNTCDDQNDPVGCALSRKLTVPQVTATDIQAAVAGVSAGGSSAAPAPAPASSAPAELDGSCSGADAAQPAAGTSTSGTAPSGTVSLGAAFCSDPAIAFGAGFDGRKENSFQPDDPATFTHGSALSKFLHQLRTSVC